MTNLFAHLLQGAIIVSVLKPTTVDGLRSLDIDRDMSLLVFVGLFLFPLPVFMLFSEDNEQYIGFRRAVHIVEERMHCISVRYNLEDTKCTFEAMCEPTTQVL